jgi:DNA-binding beta-propeller fold protein YncE
VKSRFSVRVFCLTAACAAVWASAGASSASAAVGDPSILQCFSRTTVSSCAQTAGLTNVSDVELSPDGKQLYALGREEGSLVIFDVGAGNQLTRRSGPGGCFNATGAEECTASPSLTGNAYDMALSPDGESLYVAAGTSLQHFQRNESNSLVPVGCYGPLKSGCASLGLITSFSGVVVSRDGQNVYTRGSGTLGAFQRNTGDGKLIPETSGGSCYSEIAFAGCVDSDGLTENSYRLGFSADGKFLYASLGAPGGVAFFKRSEDGSLSQIAGTAGGCITPDGSSGPAAGQCVAAGAGGGAMEGSWAATLSPSGSYVFVSGPNGTVVFSRNSENGKLTQVSCIAPGALLGCAQRSGSGGMGVAVSPDGRRAIVQGYDVKGAGVYDFDEATGLLSQRPAPLACFAGIPEPATSGCAAFPGGGLFGMAAWTADGLNAFAASDSILNLAFDRPPVCQDRAYTVPGNTSTEVGLSCSDPNGDPVTISVSRKPFAGVTGEVNQAGATVRYNPFTDFAGPDSFTYSATAKGLQSAEATVGLTVTKPSTANVTPAKKKLKCKKGFRKVTVKVKGKTKTKCKKKKRRKRRHK